MVSSTKPRSSGHAFFAAIVAGDGVDGPLNSSPKNGVRSSSNPREEDEMEIWLCAKRQYGVYLNLMGYMFEQSVPLRGMAYLAPFTVMTTEERLRYAMTGELPKRVLQ